MNTLKINLQHAVSEMLHHKLRTLLTLLGMVFGVGAVIAMLSIGEGAQAEATRLIEKMGLRNLVIEEKQKRDVFATNPLPIDTLDFEEFKGLMAKESLQQL